MNHLVLLCNSVLLYFYNNFSHKQSSRKKKTRTRRVEWFPFQTEPFRFLKKAGRPRLSRYSPNGGRQITAGLFSFSVAKRSIDCLTLS